MELNEESLGLVTPGVYEVHRNGSSQVDATVRDKNSVVEQGLSCKLSNGEGNERYQRKPTDRVPHPVELSAALPLDGLLSSSEDRGPQEGCVMVDFQGNVVKEGSSHQDQSASCLMNDQVLVQVSNGGEVSRPPEFVSVFIGSEQNSADVGLNNRELAKVTGCQRNGDNLNNNSDNSNAQDKPALVETRFVFHDLSSSECILGIPSGSQTENQDVKLEHDNEDDTQTPRRRSARKARMKWRNLDEDDNVIRKINHLKKRKHYPLSPSENANVTIPKDTKVDLPLPSIPIWAQHLLSVRIIDGKWIYGIATSKNMLHQTLEAHSRSILCDYIKSHPSNFKNRRTARSQECRVMWKHKRVMFDGIPFIIVSSDDLKCTFGMNYKVPKKKDDNVSELLPNPDSGSTVDDPEGAEKDKEKKNKAQKKTDTPKKSYKDVMFTSCPAKITVKVIVKYPGYAVQPFAFQTERKFMMKRLRNDLSKKVAIEKQELYCIMLPCRSVHNHLFTGRSRNIHPSIISKVKEIVQGGVTAPKLIKTVLDDHVQMKHMQDVVPPHPDDRAYYPKVKDIGNLVYNYCKKMGIQSRRKNPAGQSGELSSGKRKRRKSSQSEDNDAENCANTIANDLPLQASTLQEAVRTFCTDEPERGTTTTIGGEECAPPANNDLPNASSTVTSMGEMVRGQLESLRNITYSLNEPGSLQDLYQSLQGLINQYVSVNQPILQGGIGTSAAPATAYIIHESVIDPLPVAVSEDHLQVGPVAETIPNSLTIPGRDATSMMTTTTKFRNAQVMENSHMRQFKSPVALQCLTTNVVPTLTMSQLPVTRSSNQSLDQNSSHLVTSIPTHSTSNPPTVTMTQPTYQTVTPMSQDTSAVPVQLSLPPYFYYVQEVTVPENNPASSSLNR